MTDSKNKLKDEKQIENFFISLKKERGLLVSYGFSTDVDALKEQSDIPIPVEDEKKKPAPELPVTFSGVFKSYVSVMEMYRNILPSTATFGPLVSTIAAGNKIDEFVKSRGIEKPEFSSEKTKIYELKLPCFREFMSYKAAIDSANEAAAHLPQIMVIGLISSYDAFLAQMLRVIFNVHPETILTSEKTIKFSELSKFPSMEDARKTLIDREIETIVRMSHHEQFAWMEKAFDIKLKADQQLWSAFIELCERRNLLTHTGGIVSLQYLSNCQAHGIDVEGIRIGEKLQVDGDYLQSSVAVIYEIGIKLCQTFWRKFVKSEVELADDHLNELGYDLIHGYAYSTAESLLRFGTNLKKHANDSSRRRMVVNLANTIRLQKREDEANKLLDQEDWSAIDDQFKISVAAVRNNKSEVLSLMRSIGKNSRPSAEAYRTWPVFRGMKEDEDFMLAFEEVFEEPLISSKTIKVSLPPSENKILPFEPPTALQ